MEQLRTRLIGWTGTPLDAKNAGSILDERTHLLSIAPTHAMQAVLRRRSQHRTAAHPDVGSLRHQRRSASPGAIETALPENPDLGDEANSVVFFMDVGLKRCQQMFADLNRFSVRPTKTLGLLYDHRDQDARVAKGGVERVSVFNGLTETERSTISNRSIKLFTLSGIYHATQTLLQGLDLPTPEQQLETASEFWSEVSKHIPDGQLARDRKVSAADLRRDYVHALSLALAALARVGNAVLRNAAYTDLRDTARQIPIDLKQVVVWQIDPRCR